MAVFVLVFTGLGSYFIFFSNASTASTTLPSDINNDGTVDVQDLSLLLSSYGSPTSACVTAPQYTCDLNGSGGVTIVDLSILLSHFGETLPTVTLTANPTTITSGSSSILTWSSTNATSCAAASPSGWTSSTATSGTQSVSPSSNTNYTLICTGSGGNTTSSPATVTVSSGTTYSYYVNCSTGSNSNNGTSSSTPWQTLPKVSSTTFLPSTTIYLAAGCTWDGGMTLHGTGTSGSPIVLTSYGSGPAPIVKNTTGGAHSVNVTMAGAYQTVQNLLIENGTPYVSGATAGNDGAVIITADHDTVNNNTMTAVGTGVDTTSSGTNALIEYNNVHDMQTSLNQVGNNQDYGGDCFSISSANVTIAHNTCLNAAVPSAPFVWTGAFVQIYNTGTNLHVYDNLANTCVGFMEAGGQTGETNANGMVFDYNIIINNSTLINIHANDIFAITGDATVDNNSFYDVNAGYGNTVLIAPPGDLTVRNNIFYLNETSLPGLTMFYDDSGGTATAPTTHTYNIYKTLGTYAQVGYTLGTGEVATDPLWVSPSTGNFHLQSGSPARGAGTHLSYTLDYNGVAVANPPDIGALQYP